MMVSRLFSEGMKPVGQQTILNHAIDYPRFDEIAFFLSGLKPIAQLSTKAWLLIKSRLVTADLSDKKQNLNISQESELIKQLLAELRAAMAHKDIKEEDSTRIMALIEIYMALRMLNNIKLDILKKLEGSDGEGGGGKGARLEVPKFRKHF